MKLLFFIFIATGLIAQSMNINTPYRGALYDKVKPFMQELFERNKLQLEYQRLPLSRALSRANDGIDDGDGPRVKAVEKKFKNLRRVDVPILKIAIHAHVKDIKLLKIKSWEDIKPYAVGVRRGTVIQVKNLKRVNHKNIIYVTTNEQLFQLLEAGRIDVAIAERFMARTVKEQKHLEHLYQTEPLLEKNMYLYMHKKHSGLLPALTNTLMEMKNEGKLKALDDFYRGDK